MRVTYLHLTAVVGLLLLGILGCGASTPLAKEAITNYKPAAPSPASAGAPASTVRAISTDTESPAKSDASGVIAAGLGSIAASQPDRYLIKNATMVIESDDARLAVDQLTVSLAAFGGYVSDLHESVDNLGRRSLVVQIRVPADKFQASVSSAESLGKLINKQVVTEDVSEQYVDTEARSRNLKKMEERLLEHLSRAGDMKNILEVEQHLTRVREDIERLDGRLRFLSNRVAFSTLSLTIQEKPKATSVIPVTTANTASVFSDAVRSFVEFAMSVWYRAIWIAVWSPVWLVVALAAWLVRRRLVKSASRGTTSIT